jgi:hypothetical protein
MKKTKVNVVAIATLFVLGAGVTQAQFVDNFDNGIAADSDTTSGFWKPTGVVTESSGKLFLKSEYLEGKTKYPRSNVLSSSIPEADFWSGKKSIKIEGIACEVSSGVPTFKQQLRILYTAHSVKNQAYYFEDAFSASLQQNGILRVGYSTTKPQDPETNIQFNKKVSQISQIDSMELQLDGSGAQLTWAVILGRGGEFENYSGALSEADTAALRSEWNGGQYHVSVENQLASAATVGEYTSASIDKLTIQAIPQAAILGRVGEFKNYSGAFSKADALQSEWNRGPYRVAVAN